MIITVCFLLSSSTFYPKQKEKSLNLRTDHADKIVWKLAVLYHEMKGRTFSYPFVLSAQSLSVWEIYGNVQIFKIGITGLEEINTS